MLIAKARVMACLSLLLVPIPKQSQALAAITPVVAQADGVREDFAAIAMKAGWSKTRLRLAPPQLDSSSASVVKIECDVDGFRIVAGGPATEWGAAAYYGLQKMGFLFPHPRVQISPNDQQAQRSCNKTFEWRPRFIHRGFHLHTLHPNEWVRGFLEGDTAIAEDTVRWCARNQQNILQLALVGNIPIDELSAALRKPLALAARLGIARGVNVGLVQIQQMSRRLVPFGGLAFGDYYLESRLRELIESLDFEFLTLDFGLTEFHDTPRALTLRWINRAGAILEARGRHLFGKIHVSKPTADPKKNYNYLPADSQESIGVLPHTVMFYGLEDAHTPVYGRQNFGDMLAFMEREAKRRPTWYFPETSYWVGMDIDVPLLLTDYLLARSQDMDKVESAGISGHLTFTSGQELGYWLFDWTVALLTDSTKRGDALVGLRLLEEDEAVWHHIIEFQHEHFKLDQVIQQLSATNALDELPAGLKQAVHTRRTLADLAIQPAVLKAEIARLASAIDAVPSIAGVRNKELRLMLAVTFARLEHAYRIRQALQAGDDERSPLLAKATLIREAALASMQELQQTFSRYPEAHLFDQRCTHTAYGFGYLWPAGSLHFWQREEALVSNMPWLPSTYLDLFYMNIWNPFSILFDVPTVNCWQINW